MRIEKSPLIAALLVAVLTVALTAIGFAHRDVTLPDADYAAYLAAGGSAGDLCAEDHAPAQHETDAGTCEACRLVAAMALPVAESAPEIRPRPARALARPAEAQTRAARLAHALPQTRAPPRA
jgi:hypothetical protein